MVAVALFAAANPKAGASGHFQADAAPADLALPANSLIALRALPADGVQGAVSPWRPARAF